MATRKASDSNLTGRKYNDASAGASKIADIPDKPQAPVASNAPSGRAFNNGAASVAVSSGSTGGIASTFTVTSSPGSFSATGPSPVTVTGLQSATAYTFTARGNSAAGSGILTSDASNSITATTVPQAPTIGTATPSSFNVSVTFTANATGGSAITGYTVTSSSGRTGTGSSSPITVSEIVNGTYSYTVTATNANGTSAASGSTSATVLVFSATGGTVTQSGSYTIHTFLTSGTFTASGVNKSMDWVLVGGGQNGSFNGQGMGTGNGGGAGAGAVTEINNWTVTPASYTVTVGGVGGATSVTGGSADSKFNAYQGGSGGGVSAQGYPWGASQGGSGGGGSFLGPWYGPAAAGNNNPAGYTYVGNGAQNSCGGGGGGAGGNASGATGGGTRSNWAGTFAGGGLSAATSNPSSPNNGSRGNGGNGGGCCGNNSGGVAGCVAVRYLT